MIRLHVSRSAADAVRYFDTALSQADYLAQDQAKEVTGKWLGRGAPLLGLDGEVTREDFAALVHNCDPRTGEQLTARHNKDRRAALEIVFSAPKSVDVLRLRDPRITQALEESVEETFALMEEEAALTRVDTGGQKSVRRVGNLVAARFTHLTTRPLPDTGTPDPFWHQHLVCANAVYDDAEQRWKALDMHDLHRDRPYYQSVFFATLADKLADLGYPLRRTKDAFEIDVPGGNGITAKYSRRTRQIEDAAERLGITDPDKKGELGAKTRAGKRQDLTMDGLRAEWDSRLTPQERTALATVRNQAQGRRGSRTPRPSARDAVAWAMAHVFERDSTVPLTKLKEAALRYGVGGVTLEGIDREISSRGDLKVRDWQGRPFVTSDKVLREEAGIVHLAAQARGAFRPLLADESAVHWPEKINAQQKAAALHLLRSPDGVTLVTGRAGVGKTTLMHAFVDNAEARGQRVIPLAPTTEASRGVLARDGFRDPRPVQQFLLDQAKQEEARGHILWVDEGSLLGTEDALKLLERARELNARVVITADDRQHKSVPRGKFLDLLREAGVRAAEVKEIQRQQHEGYKLAVEQLSQGRTLAGFDTLDRLSWVVEEPDAEKRYGQLAHDYADLVRAGKEVLVIAPTHAEGRTVGASLSAELLRQGLLGREERSFTRLEPLNFTEAERADPLSYEPGQVVQFFQNVKGGFTRGQRVRVAQLDEKNVLVETATGETKRLPLEQAGRFQVYRQGQIGIRTGDVLRISAGGRDQEGGRLNAGSLHTVAGFDKQGNLFTSTGRVLGRDFGHLADGRVLTSVASQGKTVDTVLIAQAGESFGASSREQFYVSGSRARHQLRLYAEDKESLRRAIQKSDDAPTALELVRSKDEPPPGRRWRQRMESFKQLWERGEQAAGKALGRLRERLAEVGRRLTPASREWSYER